MQVKLRSFRNKRIEPLSQKESSFYSVTEMPSEKESKIQLQLQRHKDTPCFLNLMHAIYSLFIILLSSNTYKLTRFY